MDSKQLFEKSLKVAPGGVHSPVRAFKSVGGNPIFFKSSKGATMTSVEGKSYIDFCQSFGPNILGHRDPDVSRVVEEMVQTTWSLGACEPYSLELAEFMTEAAPWMEKLRFVCSGTEAVMSAIRVARGATNKEKILKFEGCYHGHYDGMLVKAGSGLAGKAASSSAGVPDVLAEATLVAPLDDEEALEKVFTEHGGDIAAVILEPLPANFGLLEQRKEFIYKIHELSKKHETLVIYDEVISGFRVAMGGMAEVLDTDPDLVTYGKIIGGGFPVGCYGGKSKYMDMLAPEGPVYQAGTLAASPLGMCAGLATLKKLKQENIHEKLQKRTQNWVAELNSLFQEKSSPFTVNHFGSLFWLHKQTRKPIRRVEDFESDMGELYKNLFHNLLDQGIYMAPSAFEVGFVSWAHTEDVLAQALEGIKKAL